MASPHRIRRQTWHIRAPDPETAFGLRTWFRQKQEELLQPVLVRTFDSLNPDEGEIHLNRLHIRLKLRPDENWASILPERLSSAIIQALREAVSQTDLSATAEQYHNTGLDDQLVYYLQTGTLRWFDTPAEGPAAPERLTKAARLWSSDPQRNWPRLVMATPTDARRMLAVFLRFLGLIDAAARTRWISLAFEKIRATGTEGDLQQLHGLLSSTAASAPCTAFQALVLFWAVSGKSDRTASRALRRDALAECAATTPALVDIPGWAALEAVVAGIAADEVATNPTPPPWVVPENGRDDNGAETFTDAYYQESIYQDSSSLSVTADSQPGLSVSSVGLLLLHPYLNRLFVGLGWIDEDHDQGKPFPARHLAQAASLLHWLATGNDRINEYELVFIKLLLGIRPENSLLMDGGGLSPHLHDEGETLLTAAIGHWPALGQISINGLRSAFLQRRGLLYHVADGWLLRPYPETYDVLLNKLPWGISLIRLPWMRSILHTEWTAP